MKANLNICYIIAIGILTTSDAGAPFLEYRQTNDPTFGGNYNYIVCSEEYLSHCDFHRGYCRPLYNNSANIVYANIKEKNLCFNDKINSCGKLLRFQVSAYLMEDYNTAYLHLLFDDSASLFIEIGFPFSSNPSISFALTSPYAKTAHEAQVHFGKCRIVLYNDLFEGKSQREQ
jgi:hypothetical protein